MFHEKADGVVGDLGAHRSQAEGTDYAANACCFNLRHARTNPEHALICGTPTTVAARMAEIEATGVGGVICSFRLGPMSAEVTN
ncbi:MAG: hypothetical protein ACKPAC_03645, partial [Alphaproteobacteria bacterium]